MLLIYVPCKTEQKAKDLGRKLVKEKLAFCVNIIPKTSSCYFWEGKIEETTESILLVKTNKDYESVKNRIEELHDYDVPAVLGFKVDHVNEKYKKWSEGD